jgi:uncharacterized protein involved in exopolysaccharide biosynthesis
MNRAAELLRFESRMFRLEHEILSLKFMIEESKPDVRAEYYKYVRLLRSRYGNLQSQLTAFKGDLTNIPKEKFTTIDQALNELSLLVGSTSAMLRLRLAEATYPNVV